MHGGWGMCVVFYILGHCMPRVSVDPIFVILRNDVPLERSRERGLLIWHVLWAYEDKYCKKKINVIAMIALLPLPQTIRKLM